MLLLFLLLLSLQAFEVGFAVDVVLQCCGCGPINGVPTDIMTIESDNNIVLGESRKH